MKIRALISCAWCEIGQGVHKVMLYVNVVDLVSLMLHAKFQDPRTLGSGYE